jgi:hypothetical protein
MPARLAGRLGRAVRIGSAVRATLRAAGANADSDANAHPQAAATDPDTDPDTGGDTRRLAGRSRAVSATLIRNPSTEGGSCEST